MAGNYLFERNGATGKLINEGRINAALGGYGALLAPEVQNAGVVLARAGTVALAAGEVISLQVQGGGLAGIWWARKFRGPRLTLKKLRLDRERRERAGAD
jgi:hypothetical protein